MERLIIFYLNENEKKIIGRFIESSDTNEGKRMLLNWADGSQIHGIYDSFIEDENDYDLDEDGYEEFWSFVFEVIDTKGNPPVYITEDNYFLINYHNFPDEILVDGIKIN